MAAAVAVVAVVAVALKRLPLKVLLLPLSLHWFGDVRQKCSLSQVTRHNENVRSDE